MENAAEKPTIYARIIAILRDCGAIEKQGYNQKQGYSFRGIEHVANELHPLFARHGVAIEPDVIEIIRDKIVSQSGSTLIFSLVKVRYFFTDELGSKTATTVFGEGMDSGDKSISKAMSMAFKTALQQMFIIATKEMEDPDRGDGDPDPNDNGDRGGDEKPSQQPAATTQPRNRRPRTPAGPKAPQAQTAADVFNPAAWRELAWHRKEGTFGEKSKGPQDGTLKGVHFRGYALDDILAWDPESFAYWVQNYAQHATDPDWAMKHKPEDVNLVRALSAAMDELPDLPYPQAAPTPEETAAPQQEASAPTAPPEPAPKPSSEAPATPAAPGTLKEQEDAEVARLVTSIRKMIPVHNQGEEWLMTICRKYNYCPPTATKLEELPIDKLKAVQKNWHLITGWALQKKQSETVA